MQPNQPLSETEELDLHNWLKGFVERVQALSEDDPIESMPITSLPELDGFLTAVVSAPETLMPSTWLPMIFGGEMSKSRNQEEAEHYTQLIMRHMNAIAMTLLHYPEDFEPMWSDFGDSGNNYLEAMPWCMGYMRIAGAFQKQWQAILGDDGEDLENPINSILILGSGLSEDVEEAGRETGADASAFMDYLVQRLPEDVRIIYDIFYEERTGELREVTGNPPAGAEMPSGPVEPLRHEGPRVGRNDPCPCGSGRKYKKCCLQ